MSVLTLMFLLAGLLLATAWDADGNPDTDNLPQMVLTIESGTVVDADARIEDSGESSPHERSRFFHWLRRQTIVVPEWRWRPLAVPRRGP